MELAAVVEVVAVAEAADVRLLATVSEVVAVVRWPDDCLHCSSSAPPGCLRAAVHPIDLGSHC